MEGAATPLGAAARLATGTVDPGDAVGEGGGDGGGEGDGDAAVASPLGPMSVVASCCCCCSDAVAARCSDGWPWTGGEGGGMRFLLATGGGNSGMAAGELVLSAPNNGLLLSLKSRLRERGLAVPAAAIGCSAAAQLTAAAACSACVLSATCCPAACPAALRMVAPSDAAPA